MEQHEKNIVMVLFFICVIVLTILPILSITVDRLITIKKETQASTVRTHTYLKYIDADYPYSQIKYYYDTTTKVMYIGNKDDTLTVMLDENGKPLLYSEKEK